MMENAERNVLEIRGSRLFEIELESIPSTGATWELKSPTEYVALQGRTEDSGDGAPGDSSRTRFTFEAKGTGEFLLRFQLKRPWEPSSRIEKEFLIRVVT